MPSQLHGFLKFRIEEQNGQSVIYFKERWLDLCFRNQNDSEGRRVNSKFTLLSGELRLFVGGHFISCLCEIRLC